MSLSQLQKAQIYDLYRGVECVVTSPTMYFDSGGSHHAVISGRTTFIYDPSELPKQLQYGFRTYNSSWFDYMLTRSKLLLKDLKNISDEDVVTVAKMYFAMDSDIDDEDDVPVEAARKLFERMMKKSRRLDMSGIEGHYIYMFLTRKGYATPLFIEIGHPDNGKNAVELELAEFIS